MNITAEKRAEIIGKRIKNPGTGTARDGNKARRGHQAS